MFRYNRGGAGAGAGFTSGSRFGGRGGGSSGAIGSSGATMTNDPAMKRCRVFIGNLNTLKITQQQVEETFTNYGTVLGVSVHKGYSFVQYDNESDARNAATSEDGRSYAGQVIDCNIASEPKPNQQARKRQAGGAAPWPAGGPPAKKTNFMGHSAPYTSAPAHRNLVSVSTESGLQKAVVKAPLNLDNMQAYGSSDVLYCGNCKEGFTDIHRFVDHKKNPCKLRTTCECRPVDAPEVFVCYTCGEEFRTCWTLVAHCQTTHEMPIYVEAQAQAADTAPQEGNGEEKEDVKEDSPAQ